MAEQDSSHYVYLYRDERSRPRYVGYGARPTRATAHLIASHNPALARFIENSRFTIEVAGPFQSKEAGLVVEAALISALKPDFNVAAGMSVAQFRPLGVPADYAHRLEIPPLDRNDFLRGQPEDAMPVLFVSVGERDFGDGRVGYDPANPPEDNQILERVEKWWQLRRSIPAWSVDSATSPGLLVGVHGAPGAQIVIASCLIDRTEWANAEPFPYGESKLRVPLIATPGLDAFEFRERRINREAGIAFEGIAAGFFMILNPDGTIQGGRRPRASGRLSKPKAHS
jgi:hypothetical protein